MTSRAESLRAIEREVGVLLRRVRRVLGDRARATHPDLQPAAYLLLVRLDEAGPSRASAIVEELGIDKAAVSRHLRQLADLGLLERSPDPDDRRATLLAVTPTAHRRLAEVAAARSDRFDARLRDWSATDLADFAGRLARYNEALGDPDARSHTAVSDES